MHWTRVLNVLIVLKIFNKFSLTNKSKNFSKILRFAPQAFLGVRIVSAVFVVVSTFVVEAVRDLVPNDRTDSSVINVSF